MHAILWQGTGPAAEIVREILRAALFGLAGIPMEVVDTSDALLAAADDQRLHDDTALLIIDCFYGEPTDIDRCAAIVMRTMLPVHIVHPREDAVRDVEEIAGRSLVWLPSAATIDVLLDKLHLLRALVAAEATHATESAAHGRPPAPEDGAAETAPLPAVPTSPAPLTSRERRVQQLVSLRYTNDQIAVQLGISKHTVKNHITDGMARLHLHTRRAFGAAYVPSPPSLQDPDSLDDPNDKAHL